jgi:succinyl-CoA synthetase beta subunit
MISVPIYARISGAESEKSKKMLSNSNAKLYDTVERSDFIISAIYEDE